MKSIPSEARIQNLKDEEICAWCGNSGYVVVMLRKEPHGVFEEMGPCPYCQRGYREEFPESKRENPITPTWGTEGFWQGRDIPQLERLYPNGTQPLPPAEQRKKLADLISRVSEKLGNS